VELKGRPEAPPCAEDAHCLLAPAGRSHQPLTVPSNDCQTARSRSASLAVWRRVITNSLLLLLPPQWRPEVHDTRDNQSHAKEDCKVRLRPIPDAPKQVPTALGKKSQTADECKGAEYAVKRDECASETA
jgi:hypothetical protein